MGQEVPNYTARGVDQLRDMAERVRLLSPLKPWRITIAPYRETRSLEQNDRLHTLIAHIASETGNDPRYLKEVLKGMFGPTVSMEVGGEVHVAPKPSRNYTVEEMAEVMDRIEAWAATELGIVLA